MKIEKRISYIMIILLLVNIIYYKLAKNIQKETLKIIEKKDTLNTETTAVQINLIESKINKSDWQKNENSLNKMNTEEIDPGNNTTFFNKTLNDNSTNPFKKNSSSDKQDDLVPEIGKNIKDSLTPDPLMNNNILMIQNPEDEVKNKNNPSSTHLKSFLIILFIISTIGLILVAICEYNRQKRLNLFNLNVRNNDGYYLLRD